MHISRENSLNRVSNKGRLDPLNRGMVSRRGFHTSSSSLIRGRDANQSICPKGESFSKNPGEKDLEQLAKGLLEKNI